MAGEDIAQEIRSSVSIQPDWHFFELFESSSGQITPMSILTFYTGRCERLEKSYVHTSIHPLSNTSATAYRNYRLLHALFLSH